MPENIYYPGFGFPDESIDVDRLDLTELDDGEGVPRCFDVNQFRVSAQQ